MPTKSAARPSLFIGSSKESLDFAYAIQQNLEDDAEVTVWKQGAFDLSRTTVESLVKVLRKSDFAVFVFAPNDALRLRKKTYGAVRDNVVFELGLFMGTLGRERTFIVAPKASDKLRIPTDLTGITLGKFDPNRKDGNLNAAFGPFCNDVRRDMRRLRGRRASAAPSTAKRKLPLQQQRLVVLQAQYGVDSAQLDVTSKLNDAISKGTLKIDVGNKLAGDPCVGVAKEIRVTYQYNGETKTTTVAEGAVLVLP